MNLTLKKVLRPWGAGRNLNDFRDGTNTTRNLQKKRQASDMPRKQIFKSSHKNEKICTCRDLNFSCRFGRVRIAVGTD